jgi:hypothetical protein
MEQFLLIITAGFHYFAFIPIMYPYMNTKLPFFNIVYSSTIICSVLFSVLYHYFSYLTPYAIIFGLIDYIIVGLWFAQDVLWCFLINKPIIIYLNIAVFLLHIPIMFTNNYAIYHSGWHVISAIKSCYVSSLIYLYDEKRIP